MQNNFSGELKTSPAKVNNFQIKIKSSIVQGTKFLMQKQCLAYLRKYVLVFPRAAVLGTF